MREDIKKTEIKLFQDGIGGITIDLERIGNLTLSLHGLQVGYQWWRIINIKGNIKVLIDMRVIDKIFPFHVQNSKRTYMIL